MSNKPGSAKQLEQHQDLLHTAQTALGKLLLLKAGIAKGEGDKPIEVKLDAPSVAVIQSVLFDLGKLVKAIAEQSQDQAKPKPKQKPKQKQPSKAEQAWLEEAEESQREAWISKYGNKSKSKAKAEAIREAIAEAKAIPEAKPEAIPQAIPEVKQDNQR